MFSKKDIIFSETMGVCRVDDVTKLQPKNGKAYMYYHLRALKALKDKSKVAYIPVENHSVNLRFLKTKEEAKMLLDSGVKLNEIEKQEIDYVLKMEENKK